MTAALTPVPKIQFFADDGTPLVGGKLYSYAAGTTTPLATYTTYAGTVANTNPIILDSRGEANVWLDNALYKLALYDADNALIWTVDNISSQNSSDLISYLPAGAGAVVTTVQAKLRESVSVTDFGAVSGVDCAAAVAAGTAAARELIFPAGTWTTGTTPTITGNSVMHSIPGAVVTGNMYNLGFTLGGQYQTIQNNTSSVDFSTGYFRRNVNHTGGTPGFVSSCFRAETYVTTAATNFEWAFTSVMDNSAAAGENVGAYFLGKRRSTGPTWGAVAEIIDYSGGDPATGAVALEIDVNGNGTDATNNRLGIDLAVRRTNPAGAACVAGYGIRLQNVSDATSGFTVGIDLSQCTYFQAAIRLAQTQPIAFNAVASRQLSHSGTEFLFRNPTGPVNYWKLKDDFTLLANDVQLIGTRKTGWGVATNGSKAALNGSTATLAQTSAAVAQLIIDLTAHGLIGA